MKALIVRLLLVALAGILVLAAGFVSLLSIEVGGDRAHAAALYYELGHPEIDILKVDRRCLGFMCTKVHYLVYFSSHEPVAPESGYTADLLHTYQYFEPKLGLLTIVYAPKINGSYRPVEIVLACSGDDPDVDHCDFQWVWLYQSLPIEGLWEGWR